jgi:hypothetical protein
MYNLCRMKTVWMEKWFEEAGEIRKEYFNAEFIVG